MEKLRLARQIDAEDMKAERVEWAMKQANFERELHEMRARLAQNAPEDIEEDPRIKRDLTNNVVARTTGPPKATTIPAAICMIPGCGQQVYKGASGLSRFCSRKHGE